jgi:hypothetical protein
MAARLVSRSVRRNSSANVGLRTLVLAAATSVFSCSGAETAPLSAPAREGPQEAILRIGKVWEASEEENGFRSKPSPIATFHSRVRTRLTLVPGTARAEERVEYDQRFTLQDGRSANCTASQNSTINVAYGVKAGEPGIEIAWPSAHIPRKCDAPAFPLPTLEREAGRSRFVLRADQLVAVEPPTEKRVFIPVD